jgi:hypothetical protein
MQIDIGHAVRTLATLVLVPALVAACVSNPFAPKSPTGQNSEQMRLEWAQCMRQHGVNVSDPNQSGNLVVGPTPDAGAGGTGAGNTGPSGTVDAGGDQVFQAALNACKQYQPNGGQGSGQPDPRMLDAATRFAQCMRDHGIPMQDPQASGGGVRMSGGGPGAPDPNSDQFKQAQQACQHYLDQVKRRSANS